MEEYSSLAEIAQKIKNSNKKVTLLYAFNATGKTRLSMEFKNLVNEIKDDEVIKHVVYYNAFTEDAPDDETDRIYVIAQERGK